MKQKRVLTVQDISCFGKCSNTVALPVLSAADLEAVLLPTALLSTHTGGFQNYTFLDLSDEMHRILSHWRSIGLSFDMLYTGYFGSAAQLSDVASFRDDLLAPGATVLVDPVMGDGGHLYSIYDDAFVAAMRDFCRGADLITPNVTEACLLADVPYAGDTFDTAYLEAILTGISHIGTHTAVITGVHFGNAEIGVVSRNFDTGEAIRLTAPKVSAPLHGTGDVFASALAAYQMGGFTLRDAIEHAIHFVSAAIHDTEDQLDTHWYGLHFEGQLSRLGREIQAKRTMCAQEGEKHDRSL